MQIKYNNPLTKITSLSLSTLHVKYWVSWSHQRHHLSSLKRQRRGYWASGPDFHQHVSNRTFNFPEDKEGSDFRSKFWRKGLCLRSGIKHKVSDLFNTQGQLYSGSETNKKAIEFWTPAHTSAVAQIWNTSYLTILKDVLWPGDTPNVMVLGYIMGDQMS